MHRTEFLFDVVVKWYEQVVHHIVVSACYEIFMQGMYEFSCGSVPHRGALNVVRIQYRSDIRSVTLSPCCRVKFLLNIAML